MALYFLNLRFTYVNVSCCQQHGCITFAIEWDCLFLNFICYSDLVPQMPTVADQLLSEPQKSPELGQAAELSHPQGTTEE